MFNSLVVLGKGVRLAVALARHQQVLTAELVALSGSEAGKRLRDSFGAVQTELDGLVEAAKDLHQTAGQKI